MRSHYRKHESCYKTDKSNIKTEQNYKHRHQKNKTTTYITYKKIQNFRRDLCPPSTQNNQPIFLLRHKPIKKHQKAPEKIREKTNDTIQGKEFKKKNLKAGDKRMRIAIE